MVGRLLRSFLADPRRFDIFGLHRLGIFRGMIKGWIADGELSLNPYPTPFTKKILALSTELDWKINILSEDNIVINFGLDEERSQLVFVFLAGTIADTHIVQVSSPAAKLSDIEGGISQELGNELLEDNARATNFGWAIATSKDSDLLVATADLALETIDVEELRAAVLNVAIVADKMEERFGLDNF
ncbi:hypothetical protein FKG94_21910 [Exilibacterium tricleocarpae]|uniref:YbjN domain-containing protein n=1 Tax=Exilibacterium tricleocarpae TaxID=2591008 RepID=A0A545SZ25_9GAMM|nr:hypothetical protein [Exilibacterium tricleocarpae]TQV70179.1 hypothetical protein FKG94_21910 [Exilibacterium tricleocarpae]